MKRRRRRNPSWGDVVTLAAVGTLAVVYLKRPHREGFGTLPGPRICVPNCLPGLFCNQVAMFSPSGVCPQGYR